METPKRPPGRPPAPPDKALTERHTLRMTKPLKAKIKTLGDDWARAALEKAKPPKSGE